MKAWLILVLALVVVSCSSVSRLDNQSTTDVAAVSSTQGEAPATTPASTTSTTTAEPATTLAASTTTTAPGGIVDLGTPCGVIEAWVQAAAAEDWATTWDLTHPFTQTGIPLESPNGGYAAGGPASPANVAYQDETAFSAQFWANATDRTCTFFPFGSSWDTDIGVVTLSGTELGELVAGAYEVRTDSGQWKIDNFSIFVSVEVPELNVPVAPNDLIWFKTPLGTLDAAVLLDGAEIPSTLEEHPSDLDAGRVTGTPPATLASGTYVLTVLALLENGVLDATAQVFHVN